MRKGGYYMNSDNVEALLSWWVAPDVMEREGHILVEGLNRYYAQKHLALLEAEAETFHVQDEELDSILVAVKAIPLSKVRELFGE
jgi:hypothetical protein